jgi:hypothetical protein
VCFSHFTQTYQGYTHSSYYLIRYVTLRWEIPDSRFPYYICKTRKTNRMHYENLECGLKLTKTIVWTTDENAYFSNNDEVINNSKRNETDLSSNTTIQNSQATKTQSMRCIRPMASGLNIPGIDGSVEDAGRSPCCQQAKGWTSEKILLRLPAGATDLSVLQTVPTGCRAT